MLRSDNLRVPSEMYVFQSVVQWIEADPARQRQAAEVLSLVRFPTMTQQELCTVADHPVMRADPKVQVCLAVALLPACQVMQPKAAASSYLVKAVDCIFMSLYGTAVAACPSVE